MENKQPLEIPSSQALSRYPEPSKNKRFHFMAPSLLDQCNHSLREMAHHVVNTRDEGPMVAD